MKDQLIIEEGRLIVQDKGKREGIAALQTMTQMAPTVERINDSSMSTASYT